MMESGIKPHSKVSGLFFADVAETLLKTIYIKSFFDLSKGTKKGGFFLLYFFHLIMI